MKQIAFPKIIMPSGEVFIQEVVVFSDEGQPIKHFPLKGEIAFTEWSKTTFIWKDIK